MSGSADRKRHRAIELARLETLYDLYRPKALDGDIQAGWILIKIHESKAALLGLKEKAGESDDDSLGVNDLDRIRAQRAARKQTGAD